MKAVSSLALPAAIRGAERSHAIIFDALSDRGKAYRGVVTMDEYDHTARATLADWVIRNGEPLSFAAAKLSFPHLEEASYPA